MPGDGTTFQIDLQMSGVQDAESGAVALARMADKLTAAGAASEAASAAMKVGEAAYNAAESAADRAAKALEKINIQAQQDGTGKFAERQLAAAKAADAAKAALAGEALALDKLKESADGAKKHEDALKKSHEAAKKAVGTGEFKDLADGFKKLGGPLGKVGDFLGDAEEGFGKLNKTLGEAGGIYGAIAIATVALVTGIAAVTAAAVAGVAAVLKWSVGLADANRSSQLLSDGIAGSVKGGRLLDDTIQDLEKRVPQTSDELQKMAADLAKTGLKGQDLSDALEKSAIKAAKLKWGPDFEKEANSLVKLSARLDRNFSGLFSGLHIEGLLTALSKFVDLFEESSVTGQAIKVVFESIFQPLVNGLEDLAPKIVRTFIQFEIWALKALIAIKPYGPLLLDVGKALAVLLIGFTAIAAIVTIGLIMPFAAVGVILTGLVYLGMQVLDVLMSIGEAFAEFSLTKIGQELIAGFAEGIASGGSAVLSSITGVVGGAIDAAKNLLGIASPSKVFADIGANTAEGMSSGVEDGASSVQGSLEQMVSPPDAAGGAGGSSAAGSTFMITINASSGEAEGIASEVRKVVLDIFNGTATELLTEVPA